MRWVIGGAVLSLGVAFLPGLWNQPINWADGVAAAGGLLGAGATAIAVAAAWDAYNVERKRHRAGVLLDAFSKFYDNDNRREIRAALENFGQPALRAAAKLAIDSRDALTGHQSTLVDKLDDYLNYFQFIAWLKSEGSLDEQAVEQMFRWYLKNLCDEENIWLLDYMRHFEFDGLRNFLIERAARGDRAAFCKQDGGDGAATKELLFAYGTLRAGVRSEEAREILGEQTPGREAKLPGRLFLVKHDGEEEFPAMLELWNRPGEEATMVPGEMYEVSKEQLARIDELEGFGRTADDLFVRRRREVQLKDGSHKAAWVYLWNRATDGLSLVPEGDWVRYKYKEMPKARSADGRESQ
jgi:gamma-glutamylcyclotransferase (GGCT)/AIG2-like uncharacterized protein YtfP